METIGTRGVVDTLSAEGYQLTPSYVLFLIRDRHLRSPSKGPAGILLWAPDEVGRLRSALARRGRGPAPQGSRR